MMQNNKYVQFKGQPRLPKFAIPKRYDLLLKPDLIYCKFTGTVDIKSETKILVLNAAELVLHHDSVWYKNNASHKLIIFLVVDLDLSQIFRPLAVELLEEDEVVVFEFDETLPLNEGTLRIGFDGTLNDDMQRFYRSTYEINGEKKNMAVTQFEPANARKCFPCWDDPAAKAMFKISLIVPSGLVALSNMPIIDEKTEGNLKTLAFQHIWLPLLYFKTPYALPKLDMVSIPDFQAGGMENYGLVTYRESLLLHDDQHSSTANKQQVCITVAHEVALAHQWFGNLVTIEWWTHIWLNEGFATWMSYWAADCLFPEWNIWTQFADHSNEGLTLDGLAASHPIEVEIKHPSETFEIFDAISYKKGASVIRMLQTYLGADSFQRSLASYIEEYAWSNAKTEDLWLSLEKGSGEPVNMLMKSWTKQMGYPVIFVQLRDHKLEFDQQSLSSLLSLMSAYRKELDYTVFLHLITISYKVARVTSDATPELSNYVKQFFINLFHNTAEKLGWDQQQGESHLDEMLRGEVLTALVIFRHAPTRREALRRFHAYVDVRNTPLLSPNTRKAAYVAVMQSVTTSNRRGYDTLLNIYRETDLSEEKTRILGSLASCPDPGTVLDVLNFLLSSEVRCQDAYCGLAISWEGVVTAWGWLKENWDHILKTYGPGFILTRYISRIVSQLSSPEKAAEVEEFFATRTKPCFVRALQQSLECIDINANWVRSIWEEKSFEEVVK
ncbi:hypothetical protein MKW92_009140 [Papaver armeniacum]|nr:hypothetical protein MKW92_009140 [Papaver armeniacum]